ncbi:hypothetical protein BDV95DRAFT_257413 [Massariosphaeria phaeospora]|uniref:Uncharacterized protein n=1 Tax=Massariosphaeria phaeospora TaxID=100035 RepID=A0A7C8MES9_9PLEO|nr:hypothetical protein BDV95DRAFT_257413 [Massariosphaeria phaeospora]
MSSIDGTYSPFDDYPGYSGMAPCMRTCDHSFGYNGCDRAPCWCNKGNLDLRVGSITRCASSECTFANMNTATDVSVLSGIQVMYCADRGQSPAGMTMPSTVDAMPTGSSDPFATDTFLVTGTASRTRPTSGPAATGTYTRQPLRAIVFSYSCSSSSGSTPIDITRTCNIIVN